MYLFDTFFLEFWLNYSVNKGRKLLNPPSLSLLAIESLDLESLLDWPQVPNSGFSQAPGI